MNKKSFTIIASLYFASSGLYASQGHGGTQKKAPARSAINYSSDLLESLICLEYFKNDKLDFTSVTSTGKSYAELLKSGKINSQLELGTSFNKHLKTALGLSDRLEKAKKMDLDLSAAYATLNRELANALSRKSIEMTAAMLLTPTNSSALKSPQIKKALGVDQVEAIKAKYTKLKAKYESHRESLDTLEKGLSDKALKLSTNQDVGNFLGLSNAYVNAVLQLRDHFAGDASKATLKPMDSNSSELKKINATKAYSMDAGNAEWIVAFDKNGSGRIGEKKGDGKEIQFRPLCENRIAKKHRSIEEQANDIMRAALEKGHISFSPEECATLKKAWTKPDAKGGKFDPKTPSEMFAQKLALHYGMSMQIDARWDALIANSDGIELAVPSSFVTKDEGLFKQCYELAKQGAESKANLLWEEIPEDLKDPAEIQSRMNANQYLQDRMTRLQAKELPETISIGDLNGDLCRPEFQMKMNKKTGQYELNVGLTMDQDAGDPTDEPAPELQLIYDKPLVTIDKKHMSPDFRDNQDETIDVQDDFSQYFACPEK